MMLEPIFFFFSLFFGTKIGPYTITFLIAVAARQSEKADVSV
jgi:hypothetical protein